MRRPTHVVLGLGEVGKALARVLAKGPYEVYGKDVSFTVKVRSDGKMMKIKPPKAVNAYALHVAIPWSEKFVQHVLDAKWLYRPKITIIHSTVPIGTTERIKDAVHSPVNGRHDNMEEALIRYPKWFSGPPDLARQASEIFEKIGVSCLVKENTRLTEALKLICLNYYGVLISFAGYVDDILRSLGEDYREFVSWNAVYNDWMIKQGKHDFIRPTLRPPQGTIGGHCVISGVKMLSETYPSKHSESVLKYAPRDYTVWQPANVYPSAVIGKNVSIGAFTEIGAKVVIEDDCRIGAFTFIPEGVEIRRKAWIGPHVVFGNDKYPPSHRSCWAKTIVEEEAVIGAAAVILPGVRIGKKAKIGMGAVVTKDIPAESVVVGNPAKVLSKSAWKTGGC